MTDIATLVITDVAQGNCIVAESVLRGHAMCTLFGALRVNFIAASIAMMTALLL